MRIISGNFEIYESGALYSPDLSDTKFVMSEEPEMNVIFRIVLNQEESQMTLEGVDDNSIAVIYTNPKASGAGSGTPVKVGFINGKELYVAFFVTVKSNNESYHLDYTFFLKEAKNG